MSLNNLQLQPVQVAGLYKDHLIENNSKEVHSEGENIKHLGKNLKKISLVVHHDDIPFLPDTELGFLTNILTACKLSLADVAIINQAGTRQQQVMEKLQELDAQKIILFGTGPLETGLPFHFPHFQVQEFDGRTYLSSPGLKDIEREKELKMNLWNCLKKIFGI